MNKGFYLFGAIAVLAAVIFLWFGRQAPPGPANPAAEVNPDNLPGIETGSAPWPPELAHLKERLSAIGLPVLSEEGTALHIHEHLDVFIDGKPISVPADIGVNDSAGFISPIHTHDNTAIIHVESPIKQAFTLGHFFDIWGVRFTGQCIGGYCNQREKTLKVFVNGNPVSGDPRQIGLEEHQEIVVIYGAARDLPNPIPSAYAFPPNY